MERCSYAGQCLAVTVKPNQSCLRLLEVLVEAAREGAMQVYVQTPLEAINDRQALDLLTEGLAKGGGETLRQVEEAHFLYVIPGPVGIEAVEWSPDGIKDRINRGVGYLLSMGVKEEDIDVGYQIIGSTWMWMKYPQMVEHTILLRSTIDTKASGTSDRFHK